MNIYIRVLWPHLPRSSIFMIIRIFLPETGEFCFSDQIRFKYLAYGIYFNTLKGTNGTHGHWSVSCSDISKLNDSEQLMIANRLLKIAHLLYPATSVLMIVLNPSNLLEASTFC